ncbi:MAG: hypothetical protein QXR41_06770 [Nitrososphaerota archaeon]
MAVAIKPSIEVGLRILGIAVIVYLLIYAYPRFGSSLMELPNYTLVEEFKGGGAVGYRYAYVGAWMIILSQIYVFSKYIVKGFKVRIKLARLLDMHCILNITGFTLLLIHAGFPYAFRYWEPFTRLNIFGGFEGLIGIRGLLTWLLISAFISGILSRHGVSLRLKRASNKIHFYTVLLTYVSASIHILLSLTFPETR